MEQQPTEDGEEIKTEFIEDIIEILEDNRTSDKEIEILFGISYKYHKNFSDNDLLNLGLSLEFIKKFKEQKN